MVCLDLYATFSSFFFSCITKRQSNSSSSSMYDSMTTMKPQTTTGIARKVRSSYGQLTVCLTMWGPLEAVKVTCSIQTCIPWFSTMRVQHFLENKWTSIKSPLSAINPHPLPVIFRLKSLAKEPQLVKVPGNYFVMQNCQLHKTNIKNIYSILCIQNCSSISLMSLGGS